MAGRDRTFKWSANLAYGSWVATALRSDSRVAGGIEMKVLFLSFIVGLGVGVLYGHPSEESGAANRRFTRSLRNSACRAVWDLD